MLNLIKLLVAVSLASFSVNASAYVMDTASDVRDHRKMEIHDARDHRKEEISDARAHRIVEKNTATKRHLKAEKRALKRHLRKEQKATKRHLRAEKRKAKKHIRAEVRVISREIRHLIARCGILCEGDGEFKLDGLNPKKLKHIVKHLEHLYAKLDKENHPGQGNGGNGNGQNIPEPGMIGLLALGLLAMVVRRRAKV